MPRKSKAPGKPPFPEEFRAQAEAAIAKHRKRKWVPDMVDTETGWGSPFADGKENLWWALLFEVLGTRQTSVVETFLNQLQAMDLRIWQEGKGYVADIGQIRTALSIIQSLKPRSEAQAAYAAQLFALHLSAMRLAQRITGSDQRGAAILAKTVRTYGDGLLNFRKLHGKSNKTVQRIEVHHHDHRHVHFDQGAAQNGGQPQGTEGGETPECPSLPSPTKEGRVLPFAGSSREAGVPGSRGSGGKRRT